MAKKMLIDATHPEETRVVVVDGSRVEEFDFESINKRQLAGNIYLAKVTRVEPSLQAAFIEYGGNRHGFLAFSEIHPDYYQIPVADREALLAAEEAENAAEDDEEEKPRGRSRTRKRAPKRAAAAKADAAPAGESAPAAPDEAATDEGGAEPAVAQAEDAAAAPSTTANADDETAAQASVGEDVATEIAVSDAEAAGEETGDDEGEKPRDPGAIAENAGADAAERVSEDYAADGETASTDAAASSDAAPKPAKRRRTRRRKPAEEAAAAADTLSGEASADEAGGGDDADEAPDEQVETVGADTVEDEVRPRRVRARNYKIQEVIKVRQILLVQVVKEERGNKGAALTTYLSLAGRYCVLMPNTARGGGISRKITNAADRKKLKDIAGELDVPKGMGLIVRTAGAQRTRTEIKRDYEFLLRQWEQVRELTLKSIAPTLIYEEGSLIKRSIRDLYSKEIDEILVEGDDGYREAKDYMRMLMPSHAKHVQPYREPTPLFIRHQVESYLASMFNPVVQLRSGGYIVIGVTEALVAIDVNSGRSTREGSIEDTALKTNLEAADEIARQLRLRDLAGLIVIDFIDMDERRNNAAVEKRMKERLKHDRARLQMGRISAFGLMEMSRQRLRPGMLEASTAPCPHCHGTGLIRSADSLALAILREVEEEGVRGRTQEVKVVAPVSVANFLVNHKREHVAAIELRYGLSVLIEGDPSLVSPEHRVERMKTATRPAPERRARVSAETAFAGLDDPRDDVDEDVEDAEVVAEAAPAKAAREERGDAWRDDGGEAARNKRRRGRRGGKKRRREDEGDAERSGDPMPVLDAGEASAPMTVSRSAFGDEVAPAAEVGAVAETITETALAQATHEPASAADEPEPVAEPPVAATRPESAPVEQDATADLAAEGDDEIVAEPEATEAALEQAAPVEPAEEAPDRPKRTGWWSFGAR
ncbi:MAG: ribonuclease E/G [Rhodobacteraceae bacterium]|nr:MAG: ribonuclease E/G [Paracoccaceae bacterium]